MLSQNLQFYPLPQNLPERNHRFHLPILLTLNSPAALLYSAVDVRVRRGDNHIRHSRDDDVQTVCRNGRAIPGTAKELFVNDDGSNDDIINIKQINRLIRLTRYRE